MYFLWQYCCCIGTVFPISEEDIESAVEEALALPLQPLADTLVPHTLLTIEQLTEKARKHPPAFLSPDGVRSHPLTGNALTPQKANLMGFLVGDATEGGGKLLGVTQRVLSNGMRVNLKPMDTEPQRVSMRMHIPGRWGNFISVTSMLSILSSTVLY